MAYPRASPKTRSASDPAEGSILPSRSRRERQACLVSPSPNPSKETWVMFRQTLLGLQSSSRSMASVADCQTEATISGVDFSIGVTAALLAESTPDRPYLPRVAAMASAMTETAISAGVDAPMSMPAGPLIRLRSVAPRYESQSARFYCIFREPTDPM